MSKVHYFQRYHTKENTHSGNACLLLSRLYSYNNKLFYNLISAVFEIDSENLYTQFVLQEKTSNGGSVPDFSINQPSFKLVVEAKEKPDVSKPTQLDEHSKLLISEPVLNKLFILLVPSIGNKDKTNIKNLQTQYTDIHYEIITYIDLYNRTRDILIDIKDDEMIEILEDYHDYCEDEGLIDNSSDTIMVRLAGDTMQYDIGNNLYYDTASNKWTGFDYIGLYTNKCVKYIGKIRAIYNCNNSSGSIAADCLKGTFVQKDEDAVKQSFSELFANRKNVSFTYYLVDEFVEINNFTKSSKRALYGKKKFYLSDYGLKPGASSKEIAEKLSNKNWL